MSWKGVKKQSNIENIKSWCDEIGIENYTINSQGEIDVDGFVDLRCSDFKELPHKFGTVKGFFSVYGCKKLTSLNNCPNYVGGSFGCRNCPQLDLLEGCPKEVGLYFYCDDCKRKFTKEEVRYLCKVEDNIYI